MKRVLLTLLISLVVMIIGVSAAWACLHVSGPDQHKDVKQLGQSALIYYDEGIQHLVLQTSFEGNISIPTMAWFIPVPSVPEHYGTAGKGIFDDMSRIVGLRRVQPDRRRSMERGARSRSATPKPVALRVMDEIRTGPYQIIPIQAAGPEGPAKLREWMLENDYRPISDELAAYYADRQWMFLAVRLVPEEGKEVIPSKGSIDPLYIRFESERVVYPLKLATHNGSFPVTIYLMTPEALEEEAFRGATQRGFEVAGGPNLRFIRGSGVLPRGDLISKIETIPRRAPESIDSFLDLAGVFSRANRPTIHLRVLHAPDFQMGAADPNTWAEDLSIPGVTGEQRLMGSVEFIEAAEVIEAAEEPESTTSTESTEQAQEASAVTQVREEVSVPSAQEIGQPLSEIVEPDTPFDKMRKLIYLILASVMVVLTGLAFYLHGKRRRPR